MTEKRRQDNGKSTNLSNNDKQSLSNKDTHKSRILIITDIQDKVFQYNSKLLFLLKEFNVVVDCMHISSSYSPEMELATHLTNGLYIRISDIAESNQYFIVSLSSNLKQNIISDQLNKRIVKGFFNNSNQSTKLICDICGVNSEKVYYSTTENLVRCDLTKDCRPNN